MLHSRSPHHRHLAVATATGGVIVALSLLVGPSLATSASPPGRTGQPSTEFTAIGDGALPTTRPSLRPPRAPLSTHERGYAITLALRAAGEEVRDARGTPGAEVLLVDLPLKDPGSDARVVEVSLYDYASDRTIQASVNLTRDSVEQIRTSDDLQLPPSRAEVEVALREAITSDFRPRFLDEFEQLTGASLLAPEQVIVTGVVWHGATPPGMGDIGAGDPGCGPERCVQLLIALPSGRYLSTADFFVNLSTLTTHPSESDPQP